MHFKLTKTDEAKLIELFEVKAMNIALSEFALELVDHFENDDLAAEFSDIKNKTDYINRIKELYDVDETDAFSVALIDKLASMIKESGLSDIKNNPYYQTIKDIELESKRLKFITNTYEKNQLFIENDVDTQAPMYEEKLSLAYAKEAFPYLALVENNKIWMAIIPHEMNTMNKAIEQAHGRVLVLGLGLGYYPFMISQKPEVSHILIIEKNQRIIDLFNQSIFHKFPHKNKIKIIKADAFSYLKTHHADHDYAFFDIYRDSDDFPFYLKAKQNEKHYPNLPIDYWLENTMIAYLRRIVITSLEEAYYQVEAEGETKLDLLIHTIKQKLTNETFKSFDQIVSLLEKDSLLNLVNESFDLSTSYEQ